MTSSIAFPVPCLRPIVLAISGVLLTACMSVGPNYSRPPSVNIGDGWAQPTVSAQSPQNLSKWWQSLGDPVLSQLVTQAMADNLDIRQAMARIQEARAQRDRASSGAMPTVGVSAGTTRHEQSENGPLPIRNIPGVERQQTIYEAGFDAAWELDLFGRTRRAVESAEASIQATQADADGIRMSIAAEVARSYFSMRGAQRELTVLEASVATLQKSYALTQRRYAVGDVAMADVDAARVQLSAATAGLPALQARMRASALSIAVLLGANPETGLALFNTQTPLHEARLSPIPVGERADILRRRPDVIAAERRLAARTAEIGIAMAELFPKLSISAGAGFQSLEFDSLLNSASRSFLVKPVVSWRLFDGGRVRAEIHASEAREQQAALGYEKAVLASLADAERALSDYRFGLDTLALRATARDAARSRHSRAKVRFAAGDSALTELLVQERELYDAESAYVRAYTTASTDLVALFKAFGGGWEGQELISKQSVEVDEDTTLVPVVTGVR